MVGTSATWKTEETAFLLQLRSSLSSSRFTLSLVEEENMNNFQMIEENNLAFICGGEGYHSVFHPQTWWYLFEKSMKSGRPGKPMTCDQYTPAYPGKVLPQC